MTQYDPREIYPVAFPQWERADDGTWIRYWEVRLVASPSQQAVAAVNDLGGRDVQISAEQLPDGRSLRVRTTTSLEPRSDEVFIWAAYRMLQAIDERVGRIETIQGQPREKWQPFRT